MTLSEFKLFFSVNFTFTYAIWYQQAWKFDWQPVNSICLLVSIMDLMKECTELFVAVTDENSKHLVCLCDSYNHNTTCCLFPGPFVIYEKNFTVPL